MARHLPVAAQGSALSESPSLFELIQFIAHDLPYLNGLCERAEMTEPEILRRTKEVFTYFGLPFDSASPGSGL